MENPKTTELKNYYTQRANQRIEASLALPDIKDEEALEVIQYGDLFKLALYLGLGSVAKTFGQQLIKLTDEITARNLPENSQNETT